MKRLVASCFLILALCSCGSDTAAPWKQYQVSPGPSGMDHDLADWQRSGGTFVRFTYTPLQGRMVTANGFIGSANHTVMFSYLLEERGEINEYIEETPPASPAH